MRWIATLVSGLLGLVSAALLAMIVLEPDIVRIVAGMSGLRWRVATALLCIAVLLTAALIVAFGTRARRALGMVAITLGFSGLLVLAARQPAYALEPVRYLAGDVELAGEWLGSRRRADPLRRLPLRS